MKQIIFLFIVLTQVIWAQSDFDKGNSFYHKGDYDKAIEAYESVIKTKKESAELYFNLGNCYYKKNKVAPSIFYFEKALLLQPNDIEIHNNLAFAQKMTIDEVVEVPKVGFSKILRDITATYHYETWAWLAIVFSVFFLMCFLGYYLIRHTYSKRIFFVFMLLFIFLMIVSVSAGLSEKSNYYTTRPAIVFPEVISVKSEPRATAQESFILHAGTKVFVLEKLKEYKKIQLLDLKEGWVNEKEIKEIKE